MINAVNAKKSGLSSTASMQEIAAYITANWTGGSSNGNISYQKHHHTNECYNGCPGSFDVIGTSSPDDTGWCTWTIKCNVCGEIRNEYHQSDSYWLQGFPHGQKLCAYSEGQIISATITY